MPAVSVDDWKSAFKADLEGRAGLASVTIYDAEEPTEDLNREYVVLGDWTASWERISFTVQEESAVVECRLTVHKPDSASAARTRALAIMDEVKLQIDGDGPASASVWDSFLEGYRVEESPHPQHGRRCMIEFDVRVQNHA